MPISRTTALRCGAVVTASAASSAGSSLPAFAAKAVVHPTVEDFSAIVAAYRELQIGLNRRSAERDRAVAAINEVADGYHAAMNVGADDQLWADLPIGQGSTYFPKMYYPLRTIAVSWTTPASALPVMVLPDRLTLGQLAPAEERKASGGA
jgi:hyaluronate lyase